jgi:hypothetical protein
MPTNTFSYHVFITDNTTLLPNTYKETIQSDADDNGDDGALLHFALDPNTAPGPSPLTKTSHKSVEGKTGRDYFNRPSGNHREMLKENRSRSASAERQPKSPHIAYQEKGRQPSENLSDTLRKRAEPAHEAASTSNDRSRSQIVSPAASQPAEPFKLQEVPKNKKAEARRQSDARSPSLGSPITNMAGRIKSPQIDTSVTSSPTPEDSPATSGSSYSSTQRVERPARGDSLANSTLKPSAPTPRKEIPIASPTTPTVSQPERKGSTTGSLSQLNGGYRLASPVDSPPMRSMLDPPVPPQRSAGRPPPPSMDNFTSPRAPPHPPPLAPNHRAADSVSTLHSETSQNVLTPNGGLPRYSAQGDFSMDEDFARLLSSQEQEKETGVLRRVSNAMSKKHNRSYSDRGHKKWPTNGSIDISSPTVASPNSNDEFVNQRNELRRAHQRIAELEAEKNGLQESVHSAADIRQANTMLREKRNTMAVLDTQREMVIRELEIMTEHLKRAKESSGAMDINQLKTDILKDFANSLHKLKDTLGGQIEELISKRTELTDEISNLIQMKDKGFQEYESLSAQNTKLSNMNRDLIESIQRTLKDNKQHNGGSSSIDIGRAVANANGLGIYHAHHKGGKSDLSLDVHGVTHEHSYSNLHEVDSETTLAQPQVVNIRKTGKPATKFNWKKGGQAITKNLNKGFKGAFGPSESRREDEYNIKVIGTPYGTTHTQPDMASMASMATSASSQRAKDDQTRGWFGSGKQGNGAKPGQERLRGLQQNSSSTNLAGEDSSVLYGSDLTARCEFEKRVIPAVVSRCIEEVELRGKLLISPRCHTHTNPFKGMDVEGVYRKSGGASQVTQVKSGFEKSSDYDISDPDLDIHAVTSALKNYFRRLPIPLITFDVYDQFLEAGRKLLFVSLFELY